MARFRAYTSDGSSSSSGDESDVRPITKNVQPTHVEPEEESGDESSSALSSPTSEMQEDELLTSRHTKSKSRARSALVEDENGDIQVTREVDEDIDLRVSSPSSSSRSSPASERRTGGPTMIPWAHQVGVDAQKMHVMQTSLFRMPEEAAALKALHHETPKPPRTIPILNLRPPTQSLNRKHSRDSDGDGLRHDSRERPSFAHDIDPPVYRPTRKYARVEVNSSVASGLDGAYVDAGLAFGRSFRVGWGPRGALVHLGSICGPLATPTSSANSSIITVTKTVFPTAESESDSTNETSAPAVSAKLLQHHLSYTPITKDDAGVPFAYPSSLPSASNPRITKADPESNPLSFSSFASLFPTTETEEPASLFRLGSALFDSIDLRLVGRKQTASSSAVGATAIIPEVWNRATLLRRRHALSSWLETEVKPLVDGDIRVKATGVVPGAYTPADAVFTQLTGHQISQACTTAMDAGYLKLATLVSQAGGDDSFKADILAQLQIWKAEKLAPSASAGGLSGTPNALISRGVWRVYRLLSGFLPDDIDDEDSLGSGIEELCPGLDWKRIFGLCLWYGTGIDTSVGDVVGLYESLLRRYSFSVVARPIPSWVVEQQIHGRRHPAGLSTSFPLGFGSSRASLGLFASTSNLSEREQQPEAAQYALIRLHADPALSLASALDPRSFGKDETSGGIAMCWHLYMILSRVMRVRDFADRGDPGVGRGTRRRQRGKMNGLMNGNGHAGTESSEDDLDEGEDDEIVDGHSPTADLLTSSYAFELESWGMVQEAAFVLLHIEGSVGREKAIKDLLARSAPKIDDWMTRGIVGSLKIPMAWVNEAKAMYALDQGSIYSAYELYLAAGLYNQAHDLALLELAPDAIIRRDLELLKNLFAPFDVDGRRDKIDGWFVRGKSILDYVNIMTRLPQLQDQVQAERDAGGEDITIPDAAQADELEDLARKIPKLIALLPDVLHRGRNADDRHPAALEEMTHGLLTIVQKVKPLTLIKQPILSFMDCATKVNLIRGKGYARFLQRVGA